MELKDAIDLISFHPSANQGQKWADLGCGPGLFTKALATLLPERSTIHAIDVDANAVKGVPKNYSGIEIRTSVMDFTKGDLNFEGMDGILMANSLHYVKNKRSFLKRVTGTIKRDGYFLLVDYDTEKGNRWVPYPLPIAVARELFEECSAQSFQVINKRKSVFGEQMMYAALIKI